MSDYAVIVGNLGTVLETVSFHEALQCFQEYVSQSIAHYGRVSNEDVILLENGEPMEEYFAS
jgi:hypothetical protein